MVHAMKTVGAMVIFLCAVAAAAPSQSRAEIAARDGWRVLPSEHSYQDLVARIDSAAKTNDIGVVTRASASAGARKALDRQIPGNMVIGLYHPRFAVRMLDASIAAGIEAPIRMYVTENEDGTATVSYKLPSFVFAPYMAEGGDKLAELAGELDQVFANVAEQAAGN